LELVFADLVIARGALGAAAAAAGEGDRDARRGPPPCHPAADGLDGARQLVAGHVRQPDLGVVTHPAVPLAAAQAGGLDRDPHALGGRGRIGSLPAGRRRAEGVEHDALHDAPGSVAAPPGAHVESGTTTSLPAKPLAMKSAWARWNSDRR